MTEIDRQRYIDDMHAIQTGIAMMIEHNATTGARYAEIEPKHLRVGINSAMIDTGALMALLVNKGFITMDEVDAALADMADRDVETYTKMVNDALGGEGRIHLG